LDLFVGGRVIPGSYPLPAKSYILRNDQGKFSNVTSTICPELDSLGMITDALWSDFNNDGKMDLVVVGEFMPITFLTNENNKFAHITSSGIDQYKGWWNSIVGGDFDKDGDIDYVSGNLGLNNNFQVKENHPLKVFAKDFDGNGSIDPVLACYLRESMTSDTRKLFPVHFWDEINSQSPKFRQKYSSYRQYSKATVDELLSTEDLNGALILEANHMASSYIENLGSNKFSLKQLPLLAQSAPVNGIVATDINDDGNLDVVMVGNDYGNEVFAGRYDAFTGLILSGDGKGSFEVVSSAISGFYVPGDAKALAKLYGSKGDEMFIATQNRDSLKIFSRAVSQVAQILEVQPTDSYLELVFDNGREQRIELYYGSGYLSQSSRKQRVPTGVKEIRIYNYKGESRIVVPAGI
jgi:enediyne biosynthesis protein E4